MHNPAEVKILWDAYLSQGHDEAEEKALEAAFICPVCGGALEEMSEVNWFVDDSEYECPETRKECACCGWYGEPYYDC